MGKKPRISPIARTWRWVGSQTLALPQNALTVVFLSFTKNLPEILFFLLHLQVFSAISAQKSLVKSKNPITHSRSITSELKISYVQPAILDIDQKRKSSPAHQT